MLQDMRQAPPLPAAVSRQPLIITAGAGILLTATLDLSRIASVGVPTYLSMDVVVQWGVLRRLRERTHAKAWPLIVTIVLDLGILIPFVLMKASSDVLAIVVGAAIAALIVVTQVIVVRRRRAQGE